MTKKIMIISCCFLIMVLFSCAKKTTSSIKKKVGINQYMEHPLLDDVRKGMIDELNKQGISEDNGYEIIYRNACGDQIIAAQINNQFINQNIDIIIALGTPSAQSACKATKTIPIIFGAITDPVASGLAESENKPGGNKTGTSDRWPYEKQIKLIQKIIPKAKKIGIVLNPGESNTEASMNYIRPILIENNLVAVEVPVTNSSEVLVAARSLVGRCDAMLIPGDNTVITAISSMVKVANENNIPLFAGSEASVINGALATYGNNYYQIGTTTGYLVAKIFNEDIQNIGDLPVLVSTEADLIVNLDAAKKQGVKIPQDLIEKAKKVIEAID